MIAAAVLAAVMPQTYQTRILPPAEWPRLQGTELETLWPTLMPEDTQIIAIERDGVLVGTWAVTRMVHVEGVWIAPGERRRPVIAKRLIAAMHTAARGFGASFVWTGAETDDVKQLIGKLGGVPVPFESFVLPVPPEDICPQ